MAEQKQKTLWKEGKETTIRNCVFWFVVIYAAVLTFLFVNSQIKLVNAQSELANVKATLVNQQMVICDEKIEANITAATESENVEVEGTEVEETVVEE